MFDIRLREYTPAGEKRRVIPTLGIESTDAESATATVTFTTTARVAGRMEAPFVVGLEYTTGGDWARPRNDLFIVLEDAEDAADQSDVMTFTGQSYVGWLLSQGIHWWQPDSPDGRTRVYDMTPGKLVRQLMREAQDPGRGWAPMLTAGFTDTADSLGQKWEPDDQIKMKIDLWRPYSALFQAWIESGHFEWWAEGTTLMLARLGTGADLTQRVVLGGPKFTSAQAKTDFKGTFSTIVLIPDKMNATHAFNAGADKRFGALETSMSLSGVSDRDTALRLALPVMKENRAKKLELSYDWAPTVGGPRPWADFTVGDLVNARRKVGKLPQRVVGIQVTKRDGLVNARAIVGSKLVGLQAKLAKRVGQQNVGSIIGGSGTGVPSNDGVERPAPIAPTGLAVTSEPYFDDYGTAFASVTATCSSVTTDVIGGTIAVESYELWGRKKAAGESWIRLTRTFAEPPVMTYTGLLSGEIWEFKVRAVVGEALRSEFSDIVVELLARDLVPPPRPAPPSGEARMGQVILTHDGLTEDGQEQPVDFAHFNVWVSTTETGNGAKAGEMKTNDTFVAPQGDYDVPRWFWVTAEDKSGNKSDPSGRISVTTKSMVPEDISDQVMDSITEIVSQDVVTNIGGTLTWSTLAPTLPDGDGKPVGALWYRRDSGNNIIGMWEWTGTTWLQRSLDSGSIAKDAITSAKIATGAVLEGAIADAAVATAALKDSAVSEQKIANLAVGTAKIADAAIVTAKIGDLAVSTAKIADAAIVTAKIGDAAITTAKIGDASITNAKIVNIDAGKLTTGFIDAARIDARTIAAEKLAIADFSNYAQGSDFEGATHPWDLRLGASVYDTTNVNWTPHSGTKALVIRSSGGTGTAAILTSPIATGEGEQWYVEFWAARSAAWDGTAENSKLRIGTQSGSLIMGLPYDAASLPHVNSGFAKFSASFRVPAGVTGLRPTLVTNATAGDAYIDDIIIRRMAGGELIVDGAITSLKIATNAIESNHIKANVILSDHIQAGAITTVKLASLSITSDKIAANAITASELTANAITSKHTITGAKFQTTATANRGIEITSAGLTAYNSAGQATVSISATTGDATFSGTIRNRTTGPRVQINSTDTRGVVWFHTGLETSRAASIGSDPNGEGLLLFGGALAGGVRRSTLQLYEQGENSVAGWLLGQIPVSGSTVSPMGYINYSTSTQLSMARTSGHFLALNANGYTQSVGNGFQVYGDFATYNGTKNFIMDHPTEPGMQLKHASTESPHNGIEYWSDGFQTIPEGGTCEVVLPRYFEALAAPDHRTVILTAGSSDAGLWSTAVEDGRFVVGGTPGARFAWLVKARRTRMVDGVDALAFEVESVSDSEPDTPSPELEEN